MLPEFMNLLRKFYFMRAAARSVKIKIILFQKWRIENEIWLSFYHHVHSPFSIFNYPRIFCSVYLSEQLCYTIY